MRAAILVLAAVALSDAPVQARTLQARDARTPVVVELYTAQGCASCPEANKLIAPLTARRDVVALTFPVDYWDYLGWKDTFAKPEFGDRQRVYVERLRVREIYTPEIVVDGRLEAPAVSAAKVDGLISEAKSARRADPAAPRLTLLRRGARVGVSEGAAPRRAADVWLIRYDPRERAVKVRGDDRRIKTVMHYNVVVEVLRLGAWRGRARSFALPAVRAEGLKGVVVVQSAKGGLILSAIRVG